MDKPGRKKEVPDMQILVAVLHAPAPAATAVEVGEAVDISRQGAHKRLAELEERGLVQSVKKGSRLWWLTDEGLAHIGDKAAQSDADPGS